MAYTATVTITSPRAHRDAGRDGLGFVRGVINISNYNPTLAELTGITGLFRDIPTVILGGCSDQGYMVAWDSTSKSVKAWYPTQQTASAGNRVGIEAAAADNVGNVEFIAYGRM